MPAVCGVAIDVPDSKTAPVPVPIPTEAMLTPGAVTSGLSALSPVRGPYELKLASFRNPGLVIGILVRVTVGVVAAAAAISVARSFRTAPMNGIVTV